MEKILLVGLGNPGSKYINTRHNLGIRVLRQWFEDMKKEALQFEDWQEDKKTYSEIAQARYREKSLHCLFPLTYMNNSGKAVVLYSQKERIGHANILIVHDDLELSFGDAKFSKGLGAKGHKGVRSIHQYMETLDMPRIRLGIGRPPDNIPVNNFVLQNFSSDEEAGMANIYIKFEELLAKSLSADNLTFEDVS